MRSETGPEAMREAFHGFVEKGKQALYGPTEARRHARDTPETCVATRRVIRGVPATPALSGALRGTLRPPPGPTVGPVIHTRLCTYPRVSCVLTIRRPHIPRPIHNPSTVNCG